MCSVARCRKVLARPSLYLLISILILICYTKLEFTPGRYLHLVYWMWLSSILPGWLCIITKNTEEHTGMVIRIHDSTCLLVASDFARDWGSNILQWSKYIHKENLSEIRGRKIFYRWSQRGVAATFFCGLYWSSSLFSGVTSRTAWNGFNNKTC